MREKWTRNPNGPISVKLLVIAIVIVSTMTSIYAQSPSEMEAMRARLARARALAAAHNLAAAANEFDAIRKTSTDDAVRGVARLMLMGILLEEGNYVRAQTLLEEIYAARSAQSENSTESYFALAGQALNGSREHIERYRSFGINVADKDLPADAISDLDRLRALLERIADQARQMSAEETKATAATALLEDVSSLRASLARNNKERQQWQDEMASARQKLSGEEARMTPVRRTATQPRTIPARAETTALARNETSNNSTVRASSPPPTTTNTVAETRSAQASQSPADTNTQPSESAKAQDGKPVNVGSLIDKATQKVNPSYPQTAKGARITGVVTVFIEVDPTGAVSTAQSTTGPIMLRQAAVDAARRWKFRPTLVDGQPVRVVGYINFNFTL